MSDAFNTWLRASGLSEAQARAARADDAPSERARPAAAEVLCALHGWEPEDADCSAAATEWRLA